MKKVGFFLFFLLLPWLLLLVAIAFIQTHTLSHVHRTCLLRIAPEWVNVCMRARPLWELILLHTHKWIAAIDDDAIECECVSNRINNIKSKSNLICVWWMHSNDCLCVCMCIRWKHWKKTRCVAEFHTATKRKRLKYVYNDVAYIYICSCT